MGGPSAAGPGRLRTGGYWLTCETLIEKAVRGKGFGWLVCISKVCSQARRGYL